MYDVNLKPCPFCGGKPHVTEYTIHREYEEMEIVCVGCGASIRRRRYQVMMRNNGPYFLGEYLPTGIYAEESAADAWNRRTSHEST